MSSLLHKEILRPYLFYSHIKKIYHAQFFAHFIRDEFNFLSCMDYIFFIIVQKHQFQDDNLTNTRQKSNFSTNDQWTSPLQL